MEVDKLIESVESSFLSRFQTGNTIVDTVITGLVVCIITYFFNRLQKLNLTELYFSWFGARNEPPPENQIIIFCDKTLAFYSLLHRIKQLDYCRAQITELREVPNIDGLEFEPDETSGYSTANLIVGQETPFKLAEDIYAAVKYTNGKDGCKNFQITVKSTVLSTDALREVIKVWGNEYTKLITPTEQEIKFYSYQKAHNQHYYRCNEYNFESSKTFDNIFFPEKDDIKKRLDFFEANKAWYEARGIPHRMVFLFHGEPGCGKTSVIKAIANHTRRHILALDLSKIFMSKEFIDIFYNNAILPKNLQDGYGNGTAIDIPHKKRLYVIEDIDCDDLKEIVDERAEILNKSKKPNMEAVFDKLSYERKLENRLSLPNLLELLDGAFEKSGRMMIITTNYPERLDKALIRPGRIDINLKFTKCTSNSLINMYQHFFKTDIPEEFKGCLPGDKWTPAEAMQVFLNHTCDPPEGLEYLITSKSEDSYDIGALVYSRQNSGTNKLGTKDSI